MNHSAQASSGVDLPKDWNKVKEAETRYSLCDSYECEKIIMRQPGKDSAVPLRPESGALFCARTGLALEQLGLCH